MALSVKKKAFCEEYLIDHNGTKAAERAGYASKFAATSAYKMLRDPEIKEYLDALILERSERTKITADRVIKEIGRIAFADIREFFNDDGEIKKPKEFTDDAAAVVAQLDTDEIFEYLDGRRTQIGNTKKIKLHSKVVALDMLAKHLGLYEKDNSQQVTKIKVVRK